MKAMHANTSIPIGYYFLKRASRENTPITNLKLQKLVYYAGVWYFTLFNKKLFNDRIEAWIHGPAIPRLYSFFKAFGFNPIVVKDIGHIELSLDPKVEKFLNE